MNLEDCRIFFADEVRIAANLKSHALIHAYARVPRENFMGPPPWQIASPDQISLTTVGLASSPYVATEDPGDLYHNVLVALDPGRHLSNGQPSALARWIDALELKTGDRVYHLGCGVGYYTAIMAEVVGANGRVVASEVDASLAARARENLAAYPNVSVHAGDGADFDPGECDAIFINAGVTHPHSLWLERLSSDGRLVLPLTGAIGGGNLGGAGVVARIARKGNAFAACVVTVVAIYSCTSVRDSEMSTVLSKALATKTIFKLKSVRTDLHQQEEACLAHGTGICLSTNETT
jgi:protein-L-isoaspartate(D-aspartate) O-methyltransferase